VHGYYYGTNFNTLKATILRGLIPILIIDIQGGEKIFNKMDGFNYIFVKVKNLETIK